LNLRSHSLSPAARGWSPVSGRVRLRTLGTLGGNLAGAAFAAYLLVPNLQFFLDTGAPMALVFAIQQAWVGAIFLLRRPPRSVSTRPPDWFVAYGGWLTSFLVRPGGYHPAWAPSLGLSVQITGLALWAWAFANLARSYGIVPADRGLITSGPYALIRHPLYAAYLVGGAGYLIQSLSPWNVLVDCVTVSLQLVRIAREERHLDGRAYAQYRSRVRWRLFPGIW
jgi:protein-S-isoprenylcysteine O-methyltransferase Ste14